MPVSEAMQKLVETHIRKGRESHAKAVEITTKIAALNERMIYTNAVARLDNKAQNVIDGFVKEIFNGVNESAQAGG